MFEEHGPFRNEEKMFKGEKKEKKSMEKAERGKFCSVIESTGRWGMKAK